MAACGAPDSAWRGAGVQLVRAAAAYADDAVRSLLDSGLVGNRTAAGWPGGAQGATAAQMAIASGHADAAALLDAAGVDK